MFYLIAVVVLWTVRSTAQSCPQMTVRVYGPSDTSCGGSYNTYSMQNFSCIVHSEGIGALEVSRTNDPQWANDCFLVNAVQDYCPWTGGVYVPSIYTPSNGTNGDTEDYASCLRTQYNSDGSIPTAVELVCIDTSGTFTECGPFPVPTTSTTSSTSSTTSITPQTTPSPTNTMTPNPYLIAAVAKASSAISAANQSVSAYAANNTATALASTAASAIESAAVVNANALSMATDYSASAVVAQLQSIDNTLINATSWALSAQLGPNRAAALALVLALGPAFDEVAAAIAVAANPTSDPAPDQSPTSTMSTSSATSAAPCTLCYGCADQALVIPSPANTGVGPGSAPIPPVTYSVMASSSAASPTAVARRASGHFVPSTDFEKLASRGGMFCGNNWRVPTYYSSGKMKYSPYYNYLASFECATWMFEFVKSDTIDLPPSASGLQPVSQAYATEHIYEIQQVAFFVEWARQNDPVLQQADNNATYNTQFCDPGLGYLMSIAYPFVTAAQSPYNTQIQPIRQVYSMLEGADRNIKEFVFLETGVNGLKGTLFQGNLPDFDSVTPVNELLAFATRTYVLYQYLNDPLVAGIYRTVSNRIRQSFVDFGQACQASTNATYNQYGGVQWEQDYNAWEASYINGIQAVMQNVIYFALQWAADQINEERFNPEAADMMEQEEYAQLDGYVLLQNRRYFDITVDLQILLTGPPTTS